MPCHIDYTHLHSNTNQYCDQNVIFKIPLKPTQNTGTPTPINGGGFGILLNGVELLDLSDGAAGNTPSQSISSDQRNPSFATIAWNKDVLPTTKKQFINTSNSSQHIITGNQRDSTFNSWETSQSNDIHNLDCISDINTSKHSPLIGFAYDGFPIYGAYGYANVDGTGGITRIKSGYQLRNIKARTHHADGTDVPDGPDINSFYPLGYFKEDYEWKSSYDDESYLDEHNGRFCVTPEYPNGQYCYFTTVSTQNKLVYPYILGPTFFGNKTVVKEKSIPEQVTTFGKLLTLELKNIKCRLQNELLEWMNINLPKDNHFILQQSLDGINFTNIRMTTTADDNLQNNDYSLKEKHIQE